VPTGISDDGGNEITLTLTELPGYLQRRVYDVQAGHTYSQVEQVQIAADLAAPLADVGVQVVTDAGGGFPRDRTYAYLDGQSRAELLANLSQVISGPEFRAEYGTDANGLPLCTLRIAYPRVGGNSYLALGVPGSATGYHVAWDADSMRTRTFAVGEVAPDAADGTPTPVAVEDRPQPGLPRLDAVDDWSGTYLASTLTENASASATAYASPALDLSMTATVAAPPPGTYAVGDDVTLRLVTPLLPGGLDVAARLTEITVSAGDGTATWTVTTAQPAPRPRATLAQRLSAQDAMISALHRRGPLQVIT
jgi:hypothetical protein